jgi:hypothetical protein
MKSLPEQEHGDKTLRIREAVTMGRRIQLSKVTGHWARVKKRPGLIYGERQPVKLGSLKNLGCLASAFALPLRWVKVLDDH